MDHVRDIMTENERISNAARLYLAKTRELDECVNSDADATWLNTFNRLFFERQQAQDHLFLTIDPNFKWGADGGS